MEEIQKLVVLLKEGNPLFKLLKSLQLLQGAYLSRQEKENQIQVKFLQRLAYFGDVIFEFDPQVYLEIEGFFLPQGILESWTFPLW